MRFKENHFVGTLIFVLTTLLVILSIRSKGSHAGADDINHYLIARNSWEHPRLLLDHWGKPFFTLIASLFAQFGHMGTKMMNVIFSMLTVFFSYKICRKLNYSFSWSVILIILFSPIFTVLALTGNIEVLAGLLTIMAIYYYMEDNFAIGGILLSLNYFVRNETFIFIPFFIVYLILRKKYKAIPYLFTGFIVYSIVGAFYYQDIFWVLTQQPYGSTEGIVEPGTLTHYLGASKKLFGLLTTLFVFIGLVFTAIGFFKNKWFKSDQNNLEVLLIAMPFLAYFCGHSYLYWQSTGGSGGAMRVMASIAPLAAIVSLKGISTVLQKLPNKLNLVKYSILGLLLLIIVSSPFQVYQVPVPDFKDMQLMRKAAKWFKNSEYEDNYLIYGDIRFAALVDLNPYDKESGRWYLHSRQNPEKYLPDSAIYIWDSHFCTNFGNGDKEILLNNKYLKLIKIFEPDEPFKVRGGYDYQILFFQKLPYNDSLDNKKRYNKLEQEVESDFKTFLYKDFEFPEDEKYNIITNGYKGKGALVTEEYGLTLIYDGALLDEIRQRDYFKSTLFVSARDKAISEQLYLVGSFEKNGKIYTYVSCKELTPTEKVGWYQMEIRGKIPKVFSKYDVFKLYLRNKNSDTIYVDELTISLK